MRLEPGKKYILRNGSIAECTRGDLTYDKRYPMLLERPKGSKDPQWYFHASKMGRPRIGADTTRFLTPVQARGLEVVEEWTPGMEFRQAALQAIFATDENNDFETTQLREMMKSPGWADLQAQIAEYRKD